MTISEIRKRFYKYFEEKGHVIVPSAPMVVKDDPTLMFINAGMNQFKDYFLGNEIPKNRRVANSQKCLRVSGKHNDLEEVGVDTYHHTMFEMLGNWSFGDYFKDQAIDWAWDLLTEVYKLPEDRLYVTVFEGDTSDNLKIDQESIEIWKKHISKERIIPASKKDNFWEMGEIGPCGPCTEIHIDLRSDDERNKIDGKSLVNKDHPQVIEIWNIVFIQFNRNSDKSLVNLPETHVDTGMGIERLAMALQSKTSNYDTDLFQCLIRRIEEIAGVPYGKEETTDIALRVISDHIRAIAFSISDGQLPSNNGAGYVIRRILRRALKYAYQNLNIKTPFLGQLVSVLAKEMGDAYPELIKQQKLISKVIEEEEISFYRTLEHGIKRIEQLIEDSKKAKQQKLEGRAVFELYDTYGFPVDLTSLLAKENQMDIDLEGFNAHLQDQKNRSRNAGAIETDDWVLLGKDSISEFIGYDHIEAEISIVKYRKVVQKGKTIFQLVFDKTPFYPEGGGQVGDSGWIQSGENKTSIFDTKKENNLIVHFVSELPQTLDAHFNASINIEKRLNTARNHSATHLLHHALRSVLGTHVEQKGSLVNSKQLRFDFSHFSKVSDDQLNEIESIVISTIEKNIELNEKRNIPIAEAKKMGAMALFGEKYGESVRVIQFENSVELCGGIHINSTTDIGLFKITSESAVAAGIRRIEAISGESAQQYFRDRTAKLESISSMLKKPKNIEKSVIDLIDKNSELTKQIELLNKEKAALIKKELKQKIIEINGLNFLGEKVNLNTASIKDVLFQLKGEQKNFVGILANAELDKCGLSVILSENLIEDKNLNASKIIKEISHHIRGGGGGQAFFATAGGKDQNGIATAIEELKSML
ncbi:alanine--tRNA ligase [Crocinitomicaceae bacterium]|nr:alanine--tRNA ligase [Crocinitomicaceae bacterium]